MDTSGNAGAHTCIQTRLMKGCVYYIPNLPTSVVFFMIHDKILIAFGDESFMFLPNEHSMVGYWAHHGSDGAHRISVRFWRGSLRNGYHF